MAFRYTLPKLPSTGSQTFGGVNPFAGTDKASGFGSSSSSAGRYAGFSIPTLTERQLAQLRYNLSHKQHEGFLDRVKHGAGFTLDHVLDIASRGDYASAGFFHGFGLNKSALDGNWGKGFSEALRGLRGQDHHTFGELLANEKHPNAVEGFLQRHSKTRFAAGFGLDVALDPTSYIGVGLVGKAGKAVRLGEDAIKAEKTGSSAIRTAQAVERAKRLAPDLEHQVENATGKAASRASAQLESDHLRNIIMDEGATAAERITAARHIELRVGPTLKTSVRIRTPLKLRGTQLEKINRLTEAAKGGKLTAQVRKGVKDRFHAGWDMPIIHRMKQAAVVHGLRKWAEGHWHFARQTLEPYVGKHGAQKLDEDAQAKALAAFDKKGTVNPVTHDIVNSELEKNLTLQGFNKGTGDLQKASNFIHAWHAVTERLLHYNEAAGVQLEEDARYAFQEGRGYVPRRVNLNHEHQARFSLPELAKTQGIQRLRKDGLDYEAILQGIKDGSIPAQAALHHPSEMLAQIVNESATAQVSHLFKDAVRKAFGTDRKVFDRALGDNKFAQKIDKKETQLDTLRKQMATATVEHLTAEAARDFANTRDGNAAIRRAQGQAIKQAQADIERLQPMRKQVQRFDKAEVARIKAKSPERVRLAQHVRSLDKQIKEATGPLTPGHVTALQYQQAEHITKLQEALYRVEHTAETSTRRLEPGTEAEVHGVNGTAPKALRSAWETLYRSRLSDDEGAALEAYLSDSRSISDFLEAVGPDAIDPMDGGVSAVVHDLDSALQKSPPAPEAFTVYHGTQSARKGGIPRAGDVTADIPTYISTSTDHEVASIWAGHMDIEHPAFPGGSDYIAGGYASDIADAEQFKAVYEIRIPKGAHTIGNLKGTATGDIDEVLLQRGGHLRIHSVSEPDRFGIRRVKADFVPPKPATKSLNPEHIKRMIKKAEEDFHDPEALRRRINPVNHLKAQRKRLVNRIAAMDQHARDLHPTGHVGDISFTEVTPRGGRGIKGHTTVTLTAPDGSGFMHVALNRSEQTMHVGMVRVPPQFQRQGIATSLYKAALAIGESKGIRKLVPSDIQSAEGEAIWKKLRENPPTGWVTDSEGALVYDSTRSIKLARAHKQIKDAQRALDALPPARQVRLEHAQKLLDIANDPKRIKSFEEMTKRSKVLEKSIANLKPKALQAMYRENPAALKADLVHAISLDTKGIGGVVHEYAIPAALNEHLQRVMEALINPKKQDALDHVIRKAMTEWKKLVTTVNPGYWMRNTVSDFWNMYIADVPLWAMSKYGVKAAKMMRDAKNGDLKAKAYLLEFEARGGGSGLFIGDIRDMKSELTRSKSRYQRVTGKQVDLNGVRENWGRLIHYMYRTEHEGMSHADAAYHVREAHFDYTDLTEWEQKRMKAIAPFYTWTRKNVPFQLKKLFTRPGRVNAYQKIASNAEYASGPDGYNGPLSVALANKPLAFRIGGTYVNPQIGLQDLFTTNPLTDEGRQGIISQLNPAAKAGLELLQNRSTFTGQPIYGDGARTQTGPSWLSDILGGGQTIRDYGQGPKAYPAVPWWANYGLRQLPVSSYLLSRGDPAAEARQGGGNTFLDPKTISYFFGLSTAGVNPDYERMVAKANADEKFKVYYKWLQEQGKAPLSSRQTPSANQSTVDRSTYAAYGR